MISIIVPVYNSENHLRKCISSILNQSYVDFELLLIDDGSKDSSPSICDDMSTIDDRIRVIHKLNGGISAARNVGLDLAKGEWIAFCDNDDLVSPTWLENLISMADEDTLPICAFTRNIGELGKKKIIEGIQPKEKTEISSYIDYYQQRLGGFVWNALYSKTIIDTNKLRFPERKGKGDINEDLIFDLQYLPYINKIAYTGFADYYWASNDSNHSKKTAQRFFFEKYEEKYRLWRDFIIKNLHKEQIIYINKIATFHLYEILLSIINASTYKVMKSRINHPLVQECIREADIPSSDRKICWLIKHRLTIIIWYLSKFQHKIT